MLKRWDVAVADINTFVEVLEQLCPDIVSARRPGRPLKRPLKDYVALLVTKEENKATLRRAEASYSKQVCGGRVDHSVIHYWEKKLEVVLTALIKHISTLLRPFLTPLFNVLDSTKFSTWDQEEVEFHTHNVVTEETVLPINAYFGSMQPRRAVRGVIVPGEGDILADRWYDDNKALGEMFKAGYRPIVKPMRNRYTGFWRRKARKLYDEFSYKRRARGESPYGTLTNAYGDRLPTTLPETARTRISARIVSYLLKLYIRASKLLTIIRHAPVRSEKQPPKELLSRKGRIHRYGTKKRSGGVTGHDCNARRRRVRGSRSGSAADSLVRGVRGSRPPGP